MSRFRKILVGSLVAAVMVVGAAVFVRESSADASTQRYSFSIPVAGQVIYANQDPTGQCTGEDITLTSGEVDFRGTLTNDASGGVHGTFNVTRHDIKGIGAQSGAQYELVGTDTGNMNVVGADTLTFTDHVSVIGQGPDNNAVLSSVASATINANGEVTAQVEHFSFTCH